jgi:hypothetical protein
MNPLDRIAQYLAKLESRLRWLAVSRGTALLGGVALVITVTLVVLLNRVSFSAPALFWARFVLFLSVAAALVAGLVMPLVALNRRRSARAAESKIPAFGDRLLTFTERQRTHPNDPFLPLLAEDAMQVADQAAVQDVASPVHTFGFASVAATACAVLLWLALAGPGFLGYGTSLLWGGNPKAERKPFRAITVQPGNATLRRRMDQPVFAKLQGFDDPAAAVFARYASSAKWEQAPMQHQANGPAFEFVFAALPENVEYYVESSGVRSDVYKLSVSDLPEVKKISVTYHFPAYYGMKDVTEDPGGDLRAVEGTTAEVQVTAGQPLTGGALVLDSGESFPLSGSNQVGKVPILKDGMYHVAALDHGTVVRLSEDYFIEARKDTPPTVSITRPGRDAKVSPVEEVPVHIQARDDYGLQAVDLHYSVNGGAEQTKSILSGRGAKTTEGSVLLSMEDFHAVPGDIVSLYATAKDARTTAHTDILFIQAKPFEFNYSQSQQEGQPGASGDPSQKISERQQEIIAATFNQLRDTGKGKATAQENAKYLADVQSKLRDQAKSLADRMKSRDLGSTNPATQSFVQNVELAVKQMEPAAEQLRGAQWQPALSPEQKALQFLLRAEANFRDIQISMAKGQGSGSAGGSRDMENLSELELDTNKNQYESGRQSAEDDQQKKVDDALARLKELAKRQQQLAEQQQRNQPNFQQRWEQEMLRREAEQLRREMQQMAQNQQGQSQLPSQQQQQSKAGQQGQGGTASQQQSQQQGQPQSNQQKQQQAGGGQAQQRQQSGQQQDPQIAHNPSSGSQQTLQQALERLSEATRNMSDAASSGAKQQNGNNGQTQAEARRAAERLQEAGDMLAQMRRKQTGSEVDDLAQQANALAQNEEDFMNRLRQKFGGEAGADRSEAENRRLSEQMANEKQRLREQMQGLEHGMQKTARDMSSTQPGASSKMREAISTLQQDEVESRMKRAEDMIRRGRASYAVMSEATVLRALNDVKDKLSEAQSAMSRTPNQEQGLERALAQAAKLRQSMERATASNAKQPGRRPGNGAEGQQQASNGSPQKGQAPGQGNQHGQQGQPGSQSNGKGEQGQPGQGGESGQDGQSGEPSSSGGQGSAPGGQRGLGQNGGGGPSIGTYAGGRGGDVQPMSQQDYDGLVRQLQQLQQMSRDNRDLTQSLNSLARDLAAIDPRRAPANPRMLEQIEAQLLTKTEEVELLLRRKVDEKQGATVRSSAPSPVPQGYGDAVAEYYRRLSRVK